MGESFVEAIGKQFVDESSSLADKFRALFTLKNTGGHKAIDWICKGFEHDSALLKHECAYCLGQMQDEYAIPFLIRVLEDRNQEPMVRHEAGEALGAIGAPEVIDVLTKCLNDEQIEVAETCELALERIKWLQERQTHEKDKISSNPYSSVDPAPPDLNSLNDTVSLRKALLDESLPLFKRYRALFSLRNIGGTKAVVALAEGLRCNSALFRHEIAYVLGQMQHEACVTQLKECLEKNTENPMVRHECAEALGAIAKGECREILEKFAQDKERVVKESCLVALDMHDYQTSDELEYTKTIDNKTKGTVGSE
ncbi:deoxyhypusine hydroxylase-like [Dendronephthya gigantea]|uniref:deoxyhypusine hydroxylase-like n=1 Tax=Dendronephthya gigantea TaxID=151771 RepID=UPI0010690363|nr:deoxyhypusine hydroxylase-like [Dendronephthya gigantea]